MDYTHAQLLALKRDDPRAYAIALEGIEARLDKTAPPEREAPISPSMLEAGLPTQAAGVKTHSTDMRLKIRRPSWANATVNGIIDDALDYAPDPHFAAATAKALGLQGWTLNVFTAGTEEPDDVAKAEVEMFADRCARQYGGGIDALLQVGLDSVMRRGAVALELDIADSRDDVLDIDLVDPTVVDFRVETEGNHRHVYPVYCPTGGREPVRLSELTFAYVGAGVRVGQPHGQTPFLPLVDTTYPQARLRDNLTRVTDQQGFSRQAFIIDSGKAIDQAPPDVAKRLPDGSIQIVDWQKYKTYMNSVRSDMETTVKDMYADDVWVLWDTIQPDSVGADHGTKSFRPLEIAQVFDQDEIVACLGQPAIHGRNWGAALSTTGNVQWLVYTLGLEGLRDIPARAVEWALNQYLRIRGINAEAHLVFEPIRKSDVLEEAQAEKIRTETVAAQLAMNVISLDEAAELLTGHDAPVSQTVGSATDSEPPSSNGAAIAVAEERSHGDAGGDGILGRNGAGGGHTNGGGPCTCSECTDIEWEREPFAATGDPLTADELAALAAVDDDDARRARRKFDRWARDSAAVFVGMLGASIWREGRARAGWNYAVPKARYHYPASVAGVLGRPLPGQRLVDVFARRMIEHQAAGQSATEALLQRRIGVGAWERQMAEAIRASHLEARMFGVGGQFGMSAADYEATMLRIRAQHDYLHGFGRQIANGELSEARIRQRAGQYYEAAQRETYRRASEDMHRQAGYDQEQNVLGVADHCVDCEGETTRGWVEMGTLLPIGERACRSNCACHVTYRVKPTTEPALMAPIGAYA